MVGISVAVVTGGIIGLTIANCLISASQRYSDSFCINFP
jgi:hypothetical protein